MSLGETDKIAIYDMLLPRDVKHVSQNTLREILDPLFVATSIDDLYQKWRVVQELNSKMELVEDLKMQVQLSNLQSVDPTDPLLCQIKIDFTEPKRFTCTAKTSTNNNLDSVVSLVGNCTNFVTGNAEKMSFEYTKTSHKNDVFSFNFSYPWLSQSQIWKLHTRIFQDSGSYMFCGKHSQEDLGGAVSIEKGDHSIEYELVHRNVILNSKVSEGMLLEGGQHVKSSLSYRYRQQVMIPGIPMISSEPISSTLEVEHQFAGFGGDVKHWKFQLLNDFLLNFSSDILVNWFCRLGIHFPIFGSRSYISDRYFFGGNVFSSRSDPGTNCTSTTF